MNELNNIKNFRGTHRKRVDIESLFDSNNETVEASSMSQRQAFKRGLCENDEAFVRGKYIKHQDGTKEWLSESQFERDYANISEFHKYDKDLQICLDIISRLKYKLQEIGNPFGDKDDSLNILLQNKIKEILNILENMAANAQWKKSYGNCAGCGISNLSYNDAMLLLHEGYRVSNDLWESSCRPKKHLIMWDSGYFKPDIKVGSKNSEMYFGELIVEIDPYSCFAKPFVPTQEDTESNYWRAIYCNDR